MEQDTEWLKMHDLFRDLAITMMTKDHCFLTKAGMGLNDYPHVVEYKQARKISLFRNQIDRLNNVSMSLNIVINTQSTFIHLFFVFLSNPKSAGP